MEVMHWKMVKNLIFMEIDDEKWSKKIIFANFVILWVNQQSKFNYQISLIIHVNSKV